MISGITTTVARLRCACFYKCVINLKKLPVSIHHVKKIRYIINLILIRKDIIIDFNSDKFDHIRNTDDTYLDGDHLSKKGGDRVLREIEKAM